MSSERHGKLFRNGRSFELAGDQAVMRKEGDRLIIDPAPQKSLIELLDTLAPIEEDFAPIPDQAPEDVAL